MPDNLRQPSLNLSRQDATSPDDYSLTIEEADKPRQEPATLRDLSRQVAAPVAVEISSESNQSASATPLDVSRQAATRPDLSGKYIERLEGEVDFLHEEIATKNAQIKELSERSRETNVLIGGLQRMLAPLLG